MDLTRLYQLTTDELRAAAQRLGVNDSHGLSRAQLIGVIRQRSPQPEPPPSKGLFGRVMGIAKKAIQSLPIDPPFAEASEGRGQPLSSVASAKGEVRVTPSAKASEVKPDPLSTVALAKGEAPVGAFSPPASRPSRPAAVFDEPIVTKTMARILAEQGHFKRSLAMYGSLMRERPLDDSLKEEALNVRTQARARLN